LHRRIVADCLKLCKALGYDFNTVEFAVQDGVPYAIDFLNPAPDADVHSVGQANFDWVVENVAQLAIDKALANERPQLQYHWSQFLQARQEATVS
jgi:CHASE1-domain containing sensor protein